MEGLHDPGFHVAIAKPTDSGHRLFKSTNYLSLNRIPPERPLSVNPEVTSGDLHRGHEAGTPGPFKFVENF
eukprot:1608076-Amphidinium_carterae.2